LGNEGLSSGGTKLIPIIITAEVTLPSPSRPRSTLMEEASPRTNMLENFGSRGLHYPLNDKVSHRQWDCNNDDQERNPPRMSEDGRRMRVDTGKEDHSPPNASI
ncbi:hypothetical protein Tco_0575712, partial [Tanacetum coccineum]